MNTEKKQLRTLIIDDHKLARDGLKIIMFSLRKYFDVVVTEAESGEDGIRKLNQQDFNFVLVDYELPGFSGADTIQQIRRFNADVKILAVSHNLEFTYIYSVQAAGGNGYVSKSIEPPEMLQAIRAIFKGDAYYSNDIALKLIHPKIMARPTAQPGAHKFTKREIQVLKLMLDGFTNEEIAGKLHVSKRTVDTHRQNMITRFKVNNSFGLIKFALQRGVISINSV